MRVRFCVDGDRTGYTCCSSDVLVTHVIQPDWWSRWRYRDIHWLALVTLAWDGCTVCKGIGDIIRGRHFFAPNKRFSGECSTKQQIFDSLDGSVYGSRDI